MSTEHYLFHIAYFIAQKGHMVELEKLHGVEFKFDSYENETAVTTLWNLLQNICLMKVLVKV